jgi:hypothetical protein
MGLDSYLYKKNYVENWEHTPSERRYSVDVKKGGLECNIKPERISYIIEQVGYWRKFNALHNYIVENYADGRDECQQIYLDEDNLRELLNTLEEAQDVLLSAFSDEFKSGKLSKILPTSEGFFFGSTAFDDYYAESVAYTISVLTDLLDECEECGDDCSFYYQASW